MARCKNCNQVYSDSYLINGICEDCIEEDKKYKELNSEQMKLKDMLSSKYDLTLNSFLKAKEEVEKLKSIHNIDIDIENYLLIKKNIAPFENTLLQKRKELVTLDSYGNKVFDAWYNEIDYFIKNLNIDNKLIYDPIIKNIIIIEIEEKILSAKNENSVSNILSPQANADLKDLKQSTKKILGIFLSILIIWIIFTTIINSKVTNNFEKQYNISDNCSYAYEKATYYSNITSKGSLNTKEDACKQADALEQLINWMGTMEKSCTNFNSKYGTMYELNKKLLVIAVSKCGH